MLTILYVRPHHFFLKQLKKASASIKDMLNFYTGSLRLVLECAPVWHSSFTVEHSNCL